MMIDYDAGSPGHRVAYDKGAIEEVARAYVAAREAGDEAGMAAAKARLVEACDGFVHHSTARLRRIFHLTSAYGDVLQEGFIGLLRAVELFDPSLGLFTSYAPWWIHQAVFNGCVGMRFPVSLKRHVFWPMVRWRKAATRLAGTLGRAPTSDEVAAAIKLPARYVGRVLAAIAVADSAAETQSLRYDSCEVACDGGDAAAGIDAAALAGAVAAALMCIHARDREVLTRRYGLDGGPAETLEVIASGMGRTRERVRQLESRALVKMASLLGVPVRDWNGSKLVPYLKYAYSHAARVATVKARYKHENEHKLAHVGRTPKRESA